jgi:hypothetical protein
VPLSYWFTAQPSNSANRLLWVVSFELPALRLVLVYIGAAIVVFGGALFVLDLPEGMPLWWSLAEGPINMELGVISLSFSYRRGRGHGTV